MAGDSHLAPQRRCRASTQPGAAYQLLESRLLLSGVQPVSPVFLAEPAGDQGRIASPSVAVDADGDMLAVWRTGGEQGQAVFAQRLDSQGLARSPVFRLATGPMEGFIQETAVAMSADGAFALAWLAVDSAQGVERLFVQQYTSAFSPSGAPLQVLSADLWVDDTFGDIGVAVFDGDDLLVSWQQDQADTGESGVWVRRLQGDGSPVWAQDLYVAGSADWHLYAPAIAAKPSGDFIVAWSDAEAIRCGRFTAAGIAQQGEPVEVSSSPVPGEGPMGPSVAVHALGAFAVSWLDADAEEPRVRAQSFNSIAQPTAAPVTLLTPTWDELLDAFDWTLAGGAGGDLALAWLDWAGEGLPDMLLQPLYSSLDPAGDAVRVAVGDSQQEDQTEAAVAGNAAGAFMRAWANGAAGEGGILAVLDDGTGSGRHTTIVVAEGDEDFLQFSPTAAMDDQGNFVIAWVKADWWSGDVDIAYRAYRADGTPAGPVIPVGAGLDVFWPVDQPSVAFSSDGSFAITWRQGQVGNSLWVCRRDLAGHVLLGPRLLQPTSAGVDISDPQVAVQADNELQMIWAQYDAGTGMNSIVTRIFTAGGKLSGPAVTLASANGDWYAEPGLAIAADGTLLAVWRVEAPESVTESVQHLSAAGQPVGPPTTLWTWADNLFISNQALMLAPGPGWRLTWRQYDSDTSQAALMGLHLAPDAAVDGVPLPILDAAGAPYRVDPAAGLDDDGTVNVLWIGFDGQRTSVMQSIIDPAGLGGSITRQLDWDYGDVAMLPMAAPGAGGAAVVVWGHVDDAETLFAQWFGADGKPAAEPVAMGPLPVDFWWYTYDVAVDAAGNLLVAGHTSGQDDAGSLLVWRVSGAGVVELDLAIPEPDGVGMVEPAIVATEAGFALAWEHWDQQTDMTTIRAQRYDAQGLPLGDAIEVAEMGPVWGLARPDIAAGADGRLMVLWSAIDASVWGACYGADNDRLGRMAMLDSPLDGELWRSPAVAMDAAGDYLVAWESGLYGAPAYLMAQRFEAAVQVEMVPPRVQSVMVNSTPALGLSGVEPRPGGIVEVMVQFNEPVLFAAQDVRIEIADGLGGAGLEDYQPLAVLAGNPYTMIILFDGALIGNYAFRISLDGDMDLGAGDFSVVTDLVGNPLDGDAPDGGSGLGYLAAGQDLPSGDGYEGGSAVFYVGQCLGDVTGDMLVNAADIDALFDEMNAGTHRATFDLTGDGQANKLDVDYEIFVVLGTRYGAFALDQEVGGWDFLLWQAHYPRWEGCSWADGDGNGDHKVNGEDFLIWQANYGYGAQPSPQGLAAAESSLPADSPTGEAGDVVADADSPDPAPTLDVLADPTAGQTASAVPATDSVLDSLAGQDALAPATALPSVRPYTARIRRIARPEATVDVLDLSGEPQVMQ